jgi:GMP synthase (glutamine-hydrolysing)
VDVLALVHSESGPPGSFAHVVAEHGHRLDQRSFALGDPPPDDAAESYGAALIFGSSVQLDQDHPWLDPTRALVARLLESGVPTLGVCLGSQLIAEVAGGPVGPAPAPEVGWYEVELSASGERDPLLGAMPPRFAAFEWHSYGFGLPPGGVALAHGPDDGLQACRVGDRAWGIQFHAEVTPAIVDDWIDDDPDGEAQDPEGLRAQSAANLPRWTALGRGLCGRFLELAAARDG